MSLTLTKISLLHLLLEDLAQSSQHLSYFLVHSDCIACKLGFDERIMHVSYANFSLLQCSNDVDLSDLLIF